MGRARLAIGTPLLCLRSDQQLVAVFRAGNEDAFRVIHDRYRPRLLAYVRQMIPGSPSEAEDLLQEVFVRAYRGLRSTDRELSLRPWLYRVARNRCVDALRRPRQPAGQDVTELASVRDQDPVAASEQRESLRRLVTDVGRLPEQQRSALLLRELSGMSYADVAEVLGVSVPAVKSLLVRARVGLAAALEARDAACSAIRGELALAHERGMRPNAIARRHLRDCAGCREYRAQIRGLSKGLTALVPAAGPLGLLAKLLGAGGGTGGGATAGGAATVAGATGGTAGALASAGLIGASASHVTALVAAAVITAGSAVDLATRSSASSAHHARPIRSASVASARHGTSAPTVHRRRARGHRAHRPRGAGATIRSAPAASTSPATPDAYASTIADTPPGVPNGTVTTTSSRPASGSGADPCSVPAAAPAGLLAHMIVTVSAPATTTGAVPGCASPGSSSPTATKTLTGTSGNLGAAGSGSGAPSATSPVAGTASPTGAGASTGTGVGTSPAPGPDPVGTGTAGTGTAIPAS